jgi:hypothetical protein
MGQQAKRRREQRAALRGHRDNMLVLDGEAHANPAILAVRAEMWDDECAALVEQYAHEQRRALVNAGWKHREPNRDGIGMWDHRARRHRLIHSVARADDGQVWAHVSLSNSSNTMPDWYAVRNLGWLLYPGRFGIIVIAPEARHVNIANVAHAWFCLTAKSCPDFSYGLGGI